MRRLAVAIAVVAIAAPASARDKKDEDEESDDESDKPKKKKDKPADDEGDDKKPDKKEDEPKEGELKKQDLNGHDLGTAKRDNVFEHDRFFVDKVDEGKGTLVQGSITSTSFAYAESGGDYGMMNGNNAGQYSRMFTDLRLQTDFRHIGGGKWEARLDFRTRFVNSVANNDANSVDPAHIQSGFNGTTEYDLKEAWLVRNGVQSDVFIGRQFVADLGAVKIDGVRIDYASSSKFTYIGFAGLYPIRGSRSITTDYTELKNADGTDAGQFTGAAGGGAAYRTANAYGALGGVLLLPFNGSSEGARVYGTSNGYWRYGSTLDIYHFAIIDLLGSNAVNKGLTNLSGGINYKPAQRLRLTASYNRVDTDTLNLQAQAFLNQPDRGASVIQNEVFVSRLATTQLRGGLSAGLGDLQRFEISTAVTYRYRPGFVISSPDNVINETVPLAKGVEVYGSITDRHSYKDMRLGADIVRTFGIGTGASYQRSEVTAVRAFGARELENGHGEWEAEVSYASTKDAATSINCAGAGIGALNSCFGSSTGSLISLGGTLYYRFNQNWLGIGSLFLSHVGVTHADMTSATADPGINGFTGFARLAYRF